MLLIIVGASGSGKTTMQAEIARATGSHIVVSTTTRAIREGEVNGVDYNFKSSSEIHLNDFIEFDYFNGNFYGTREEDLNISKDYDSIIVLTPKGAKELDRWCFKKCIRTCIINLNLSKEDCVQNMIKRGDSDETIQSRVKDDNIQHDMLNLRLILDLTYKTIDEYSNVLSDIKELKETFQRLDEMRYIRDKINPKAMNLLVGNNASGKSFLRKQLGIRLANDGFICCSTSMQARTEIIPERGALCSSMLDNSEMATSQSTIILIKGLFNSIKNENPKKVFIIIDEPEIGLSKETTLMVANFIKKEVQRIGCGLLIITHSDIVLNVFNDSSDFWSLNKDYKTVEEYVKREIIATDISFFERNLLFRVIENRLLRAKQYR